MSITTKRVNDYYTRTTPLPDDLLLLDVATLAGGRTYTKLPLSGLTTFLGVTRVSTEAELISHKDDTGLVVVAAPITLTAALTTTCPFFIEPACPITTNGHVLTETGPHLSSGLYRQYTTTAGEVVYTLYATLGVYPDWFTSNILPGTTDMTTAILAAYASIPTYGRINFEYGATYKYTSQLLFLVQKQAQFVGKNTTLAYGGVSTTLDAVVFGDAITEQRNLYVEGLTFISNTTMTAGTGVRFRWLTRSTLRDVRFDHQDGTGKWWNAVWFEGFDFVTVTNFQARGQNDAVRLNGAATAEAYPKADIFFLHGKIGKSLVGLHVGGGAAGVHVATSDIINNSTNGLFDQTILTELGKTTAPNREVTFEPGAMFDTADTTHSAANFDGINVDIQDTAGNYFFKNVWNASAGKLIRVGPNFAGTIVITGGWLYNAFNTYGGLGYGIELEGIDAKLRINGVVFRNIDSYSLICTNASPAENVHISGAVFEDDVHTPRIANISPVTGAFGLLDFPIPLATSVNQRMNIITGVTGAATVGISNFANIAAGPWLEFAKSRSGIIGEHVVLQDVDVLGGVFFSGSDGTQFIGGAYFRSIIDGTPGTGDLPTALEFYTRKAGAASPALRFKITSTGGLQGMVNGTGGPVGTFTCANNKDTVVPNTAVTASSKIFLQATNAAAGTLMGSAKSLYISARTADTSFTVTTADGGAAAGTETFNYWLVN